ncbi:DinB family protein [Pedobacter punctiformis]|uniref:DinB family protein n=1 Tax=Pedobacter punctiformis TaxID=3004097 RepID=A0ABT4L4Q2_9SPHI|nr:DinB family protein [Pedobacter sp. HCMS5-2]MCZ4242892.1 DinB family protein [Pedobacter sp. HCMS5-2]
MEIIKLLLTELEGEAKTTKKFLALVPADKFGWAPHEKSMKMKSLSAHIAELPAWISLALTTDELNFATTPYVEPEVSNADDLVALFEKSYADGKSHLEKANEALLSKSWILKNGDHVLADYTKYEMIRQTFSQIIHHRAQLGVYLRLLNIPLPGSYGPSADDQSF